MDIPAILDVIRPGAQWSRANTLSELTSTWTDASLVPDQDELDYAWEDVDSKYVLSTDATDVAVPHNGIPDILADGISSCTITITKKKSNGTILTTPTLLGATVALSATAAAGTAVVISLVSPPITFAVGETVQIKEGATVEEAVLTAVGANDITANLSNSYTSAATVQRCVPHNNIVYIKTTGGKLSAENITLVNGTASITLTSSTETKVVTVTAWDGEAKGISSGTLDIQFRA